MPRSLLAGLLAIILVPLVVVANASTWALRTVLDEQVFAAAVGRALDTPSARRIIADRAGTAVVSAIEDLDPAARRVVLAALGSTDADRQTLEVAVGSRVLAALDAPRVQAARHDLVAAVHHALVSMATEPDGAVRIEGTQVVLDVSDVVERVAEDVDPRLRTFGLANLDPEQTRFVLADTEAVQQASDGLRLLETLRVVLPVVVLAVAGAIVILAHRRARALVLVGVAAMIAGVASLAVTLYGGALVAGLPADAPVATLAADAYAALTSPLLLQSGLLVLGGMLFALAGGMALATRHSAAR